MKFCFTFEKTATQKGTESLHVYTAAQKHKILKRLYSYKEMQNA